MNGDLLNHKVILVLTLVVLSMGTVFAANCYEYSAESTCSANNCSWHTEGQRSWCEDINCFIGDDTNQTYCENLNETYSLPFSCSWDNSSGDEDCNPEGGNFFGDGCDDFTTQADCGGVFFCSWNGTCNEKEGGFHQGLIVNPSCEVIRDQPTCSNITGCTWTGGSEPPCTGLEEGIQCGDVNKTICADVTFLSTCCNWNGTSCKVSFGDSCYQNIPTLASGQQFCEDKYVYNNQTACEQLAGSPWYMPCKWDNSSSECHFNSQAFGGKSSFDEVGSELACTSQGAAWKTETYTDGAGNTLSDSWCEFQFGTGGSCDSSCWACESDSDVTSASTAESVCGASALGYCEFVADTYAFNGYGWCNPKQSFIVGGGKDCKDACGGCDFLNSPEQACATSPKGCVWDNDSSAPNAVGYCYGKSQKRCATDCFSCYTESACSADGKGGSGACAWDTSFYLCKPSGFTGEICFDGVDNDGDADIDCADSGCATDKFCGGESLSDVFGDCPQYNTNGTCADGGCVWIVDSFDQEFGGENSGFCDFPGAQCWQHDENVTACNEESGCGFLNASATGGFCEENFSLFDNCFEAHNNTACDAVGACEWVTNGQHGNGGYCDSVIFAQCFNNQSRQVSQSVCESNATVNGQSTQICGWQQFGGGFAGCGPICFSQTNETCGDTNGLCENVEGLCEPTSFGGNCFEADGNFTECTTNLNQTCSWFGDPVIENAKNGSLGNFSGWCDPTGDSHFVNFVGSSPPVIIGDDENESDVGDTWDIQGVGLKDEFNRVMLGIRTYDTLAESGICNGVALFSGGLGSGQGNNTFFWYLDSDGNSTNNCASRDNSSVAGFEFSFKYSASFSNAALTESKVSYRCTNGSWGATPIPLSNSKQTMCNAVGGAMAGIDKTEMFKFQTLFNKSSDLRIYVTSGNDSANTSSVVDVGGPYFYSQGAVDFKFEDCSTSGVDADGDGLTSANDPDCFDFLKFGYVPNEAGFECNDGQDNDADGQTDCNDKGCEFSIECGGTGVPVADANDKSAPKISWLNVNTYPESAFIMYDTNEPANGSLTFYNQDNNCSTTNATVRDVGIYDDFLPAFKLWHDAPVDNFAGNFEALGSHLSNGTSYYYKTRVCDINNNCAVSACLNFTTKGSIDNCKGCTSTLNFPFSPPSGSSITDPLGNLTFNFTLPDGSNIDLGANAGSGKQLNYSQTKNFDLEISNPSATQPWCLKLVNASLNGKVATGIQNFSAGDGDLGFNSTTNGTFIGLGTTKCQELINTFRPKKLEVCIPGNNTDLYQCTAGLQNCTQKNIGTNATRVGYDSSLNVTRWQVPAEWGC